MGVLSEVDFLAVESRLDGTCFTGVRIWDVLRSWQWSRGVSVLACASYNVRREMFKQDSDTSEARIKAASKQHYFTHAMPCHMEGRRLLKLW